MPNDSTETCLYKEPVITVLEKVKGQRILRYEFVFRIRNPYRIKCSSKQALLGALLGEFIDPGQTAGQRSRA